MKPITFLFVIILILTVLTGIGLILTPDKGSITTHAINERLTEVTLRMSWTPSVRYAPFLLAEDKGFYAEEGLKVKMLTSKGSTLATKIIASGTNDFGYITGNTVLTGVTKGMPLKVIATIEQKSAACVIYFKDSGIKSPKGLEGKKIASDPASTKRQQFIAFTKKNGVDLEKIKFIPVSGLSQELQALINGDADATVTFHYTGETILENKGFTDIEKMLFDDYGIHMYSKSLTTHEDMIQKNPDLVKKFVKASIKGWEYSIAHPKEAIDIFIKYYPEKNKANELVQFKKMLPVLENEITQKYGLGYQTKERWGEMQDMLYDLQLIDKKIDVTTMYTNEFLE